MSETIEEHLIQYAWGIIANAGGGDWTKETEDWQEAAVKWREQFHSWLDTFPKDEEVEHD